MAEVAQSLPRARAVLGSLAAFGPGLLVMLADTDAGNVATAAQSGARWGFRLAPLLIALVPMLYIVQELTVRLAIFTQQGLGELIREQLGPRVSVIAGVGLGAAVLATLVTEFTGVAGVGELYGVPRCLCVPLAGAVLLSIVASGAYRRIEKVVLVIGLFQLAFLAAAIAARPGLPRVAGDLSHIPWRSGPFWFLGAALIGATFNPWMMFYQQSAVALKGLGRRDLGTARVETAFGAVLTQLLTAAVLFAAATGLGPQGASSAREPLGSVGRMSLAMAPLLGARLGPLVFSVGVLGASMVAAVISSLALAWGVGELCGVRRSLEVEPRRLSWFYTAYVAVLIVAVVIVLLSPDLVSVNVAAQVSNVALLPLLLPCLIFLASSCLPERFRLRGGYLWLTVGLSALTCGCGAAGAVQGLLPHG